MSRASRIPYHQNVYDLLQVVRWEEVEDAAAEIAAWEERTGRAFPAAMKEFYTTAVTVRTGGSDPRDWTLTLPELWSEYSNDERAHAVPEVFESFTPRPWLHIPAPPTPGFELIWENQGNWVMCARDDGSDDPPVDVSGPCFLSPGGVWDEEESETVWLTLGTFSEVVSAWVMVYYQESFAPLSYGHRSWETGLKEEQAPPKTYQNGLWLHAPAEPFCPPVIDFLTEQLHEPERSPRPGNVTTYTFRLFDDSPGAGSPAQARLSGGTIRVTADEPGLGGGLSAWWMHADSPGRLAELARLVLPFGTLRDTLRADTDVAREVLQSLRG